MTQYIGNVPEGAKYEVFDTSVKAKSNILFNTDFAINQRGYSSGSSLAGGTYGFDRWRGHASTAGSTHTLSGGVVTIDHTTPSASGFLVQPLEAGTLEVGKTYTLSWKGTAEAVVWYADGETGALHSDGLYTFVAATTNEIIYWEGDGVTVSEMKLEQGTSATPWEKPDISTELARCQRYYWKGKLAGEGFGRQYGLASHSLALAGTVSFPVTMRTAPSISTLSAGSAENCTALDIQANVHGLIQRATVTADGQYRIFSGIYEADAEL